MASPVPRSHRLRVGRVSLPGQIYMITTTTLNRRQLFHNLALGRCVVSTLRKAERSAGTLAFVVMPDHLHWLMELKDGHELSLAVNFVKSSSSRLINQRLGTRGAIWAKGYYDHALREKEDILGVATYIIHNPVRAGLSKRVGDYSLWDSAWI